MKFENLIYNLSDLQGEKIKEVYRYGGDLLLVTESNKFTILVPVIEDDPEAFEEEVIKTLGPGEAFNYLRRSSSVQAFLRKSGVIDFEEFSRLVREEYEENERKRKQLQIENEKKLYAELKAKYEGANERPSN